MSDPKNPFGVPEKQVRSTSWGALFAWSIAVVAIVVAGVGAWFWWQERAAHQGELRLLHADLDQRSADLAGALTALNTNRDFIVSLTNRIADLQKEKELAGQTAKTLEEEMREELESRDVTISKLQGKLTVTIVDRVMFDSGEAILKPDGAAVMQKIADLLAAHPELKIHVIGHTDNVPIRSAAQSRFASNWELSTARSLAAVHFLTENAGVDPRRVGAVGYGEFHPIADNATAEGRAKNRRIAITILPVELSTADAAPMVNDPAATNPVPMAAPDMPQEALPSGVLNEE